MDWLDSFSNLVQLEENGRPTLIMGERIFWRVPIVLSLPPSGDMGEVGTIDVDVESGQLQITPILIREIERHAEFLAARV